MSLHISKLLLISLFAIITANLKSQETDTSKKISTDKEILSNTKKSENIILTDVDAYHLLYKNEVKNSERLISTIQWVIGITIAFILAIIGSQFFFNYRINKKEIDYIKKDIEENISSLNSDIVKRTDEKNENNRKLLEQKADKTENDLKGSIKEYFDNKSKLLELNNKFFVLETKREFKELKADIEKNSGEIWLLKGRDSNALNSFIRTALIQIELKKEVKYILDDIIELLEKLSEISVYNSEQIEELISKIPISQKAKKSKIQDLTKDMPIYKWVENIFQNNPTSIFGLGAGLGFRNSSLFGMNVPLKKYVKNEPKAKK